MSISIPIFSNNLPNIGNAKVGTLYKLTFDIFLWVLSPNFKKDAYYDTAEYRVKIENVEEDRTADKLYVWARVLPVDPNKPVIMEAGWETVILAVTILASLGIAAYALTKVEAIIETPGGQALALGTVAIIAMIIILGIIALWKKVPIKKIFSMS
jgi:hypothetical protein